jgi:hypothetical protein
VPLAVETRPSTAIRLAVLLVLSAIDAHAATFRVDTTFDDVSRSACSDDTPARRDDAFFCLQA